MLREPTKEELLSTRSKYNLWFTNDDWQKLTDRMKEEVTDERTRNRTVDK